MKKHRILITNKTNSSQYERSSQNFLNNPNKLTLKKYKIHRRPLQNKLIIYNLVEN
jgi:hypothetical protein